ncbi:type II toxin-antitoxin system VapC family toxin [Hymenobacter sp. BT664]|uniref:Ribonuclease VapC n=1 Tax=Hymenobacter montanus TaxID=2771359 RepID=A0A927BFG8_9BACT|nr:type II toxin-antitoxin system VapC family toxin [Hymenobacter montanus]MBD2769926.1 type II toxin-antitoxin system VapC family toxin [Hymenobacter montanus]
MSLYLLDTNICIHFTKNEYGIVEKLDHVGFGNCFISELTIAEMLYGVANSVPTKQAANRHALNQLRIAFEGHILPIADCFEHYAAEKTRLRRAGRPVDDFDLMIGCTALRHGLTLVTRNTRHFAGLANLPLENWIDKL